MKLHLKTKDYSVSREEFQIVYDEHLEMLITKPQPADLDKYYQSENYISHTDANITFLDKVYQGVKKYSLGNKVRLIGKYTTSGKLLLDVGAGTGDFLLKAKKMGWEIEGVEPNTHARTLALEKEVELYPSLHTLPEKKYDVITLWHVLEHLPDLQSQIKQLISLLKVDGTLVIAVPNFNSFDAKYYKKYWAAYDVPRHLWHFSIASIQKMFATHGMKVIKTKPMVFDAFYVSLLSEKYKTGHQNIIRAFGVALWSNCKAWKTKEYSSLIYILKWRK